jgi:single-strand DNA-binding protein
MLNDAPVYLAGYMANEPKFKKVAGDVSSATLRVAYTARWQDRETGQWSDGKTTFVNVRCWRQLADNVAMCLRKGEPVLVMGRLRIRTYDDAEGRPRTAVEIEAKSVGHDLTRGMAHFLRANRPAGRRGAGAPGEHDVDGLDPGALEHGAQDSGLPDPGVPGLGERPAAVNGDGVLDERAVAEFARELSALGADAVAGPQAEPAGAEPAEDAGTESAEAAGAEPAEDASVEPASARS